MRKKRKTVKFGFESEDWVEEKAGEAVSYRLSKQAEDASEFSCRVELAGTRWKWYAEWKTHEPAVSLRADGMEDDANTAMGAARNCFYFLQDLASLEPSVLHNIGLVGLAARRSSLPF